MERLDPRKPPVKPRVAIYFSLGGLVAALTLFAYLHIWLRLPLIHTIGWPFVVAYLSTAYSWASLDWTGRNAAVRGHNAFLYVAIVVLVIVTITGEPFTAFPLWGIVVIVIAGILGYSVMAYFAVKNFFRWRSGCLNDNIDEDPHL